MECLNYCANGGMNVLYTIANGRHGWILIFLWSLGFYVDELEVGEHAR
jgi:hypothetical protein